MPLAVSLSMTRGSDVVVVTCLACGRKMVAGCPELTTGHRCRPVTIVRPKASHPSAERCPRSTVVPVFGLRPGVDFPRVGAERP